MDFLILFYLSVKLCLSYHMQKNLTFDLFDLLDLGHDILNLANKAPFYHALSFCEN